VAHSKEWPSNKYSPCVYVVGSLERAGNNMFWGVVGTIKLSTGKSEKVCKEGVRE
jgi:hypothetical protein